jgi:hypothetical protein
LNAQELHTQAMNIAEEAWVMKIQGLTPSKIKELYKEAFTLEKQAAEFYLYKTDDEPTRSILFRSAATLAYDCKEYRESERLIASALYGNPPNEIAEELRDLLEQVHFTRHLELHGINLSDDELQFSIAGKGIGYGFVASKLFIDKIKIMEKIFTRTSARILNLPFSEKNKQSTGIGLYLSATRPGSYSVTLKVGSNPEQLQLFKDEERESTINKIIDEVFECFQIYEKKGPESIKEYIVDEAYSTNVISLLKQLSPDGEEVSSVNLTRIQNEEQKSVSLKSSQKYYSLTRIAAELNIEATLSGNIQVVGTLEFADSINDSNTIKLVDLDKKLHTVIVPQGMMSDIVKPLWGELVRIHGRKNGRRIILEDITPA